MTNYQPTTSDDCVGKILEASNLEKAGEIERAVALYQEVIETDTAGNYAAVAQQAINNIQQSSSTIFSTEKSLQNAKTDASWWQKLSLRWKVTGLAIALSTIPVVVLGGAAYYVAGQAIEAQISELEEARVMEMADKASLFMYERYGDMQIIAKAGILNNPTIRSATTREQKDAVLAGYLQSYPFFMTQ